VESVSCAYLVRADIVDQHSRTVADRPVDPTIDPKWARRLPTVQRGASDLTLGYVPPAGAPGAPRRYSAVSNSPMA